MTDRQLDDIIELIANYADNIEDLQRIQANIDCLIENMEEEEEENE